MNNIVENLLRGVRKRIDKYGTFEDMDDAFIAIAADHPKLDVGSPAQFTTFKTTEYIVQNEIPGDLVECGVAEGTQVIVMALTLQALGRTDRDIYLYDTFAGMTPPTEHDRKLVANRSDPSLTVTKEKWAKLQKGDHNQWCYCPIEEVRANVLSTGYPEDKIHFVQGDVMKTVPNENHEAIAFLRLDTDFYDSTLHELVHMYDLVSPLGAISLDDYGAWEGCRKAADEFFEQRKIHPLLNRTSWKERIFLKTT